MQTKKIQIYDPPMCCSTGVCGPNIDPKLVQFSADLAWLNKQGVEVERFNLSSNPAAFAQQESVKDTLSKEGNDCLPVILADGVIVSKGIYPSKTELRKLAGIDAGVLENQPDNTNGQLAGDSKTNAAICGAGCDCKSTSSSGNKKMKTIISLLVLVAVIGALTYKGLNTKLTPSNDITIGNSSTFAFAKESAHAVSKTVSDATPVNNNKKIGEYLGSMMDLNKVAISQDAVFIFIPDSKDSPVESKTNDAVLAAQKTLKNNKINLGLYTLPASSPDYPDISKQVQAPAIIIASKGRGMSAVFGEITEPKLLQAFMASSQRGGGCGPSACGPSSGGCS